MLALKPELIGRLLSALLNAFGDGRLNKLVFLELKKSLKFFTKDDGEHNQYLELIRVADEQDWLFILVAIAYFGVPTDPELSAIYAELVPLLDAEQHRLYQDPNLSSEREQYVRNHLPPPQINLSPIVVENLRPVFLTSDANQLYGDWLRSFTDTEGIIPISLQVDNSRAKWNHLLMMKLGRCKAGIVVLSQDTPAISDESELVAELWLMWWLYWRTNKDFMPIIVCLDMIGEQLLDQPPLNQIDFESNHIIRGLTTINIQSAILKQLSENTRQRMPFESLIDDMAMIVARTTDASDLRGNLRLILKPEITFLPKDKLIPLLDDIRSDQVQWQVLGMESTNDFRISSCSADEAISRLFSFEFMFQGVKASKTFQNFKWKTSQAAQQQSLSLYALLATLSIDPKAASSLAHYIMSPKKTRRVFRINTHYPEIATLYVERAYFEYYEDEYGGLRWITRSPQIWSNRHSWRVLQITGGGGYQQGRIENAIREIYTQLTGQFDSDELETMLDSINNRVSDSDRIILLLPSTGDDQEFVEDLLDKVNEHFSLCLIDNQTLSEHMDNYRYLDPRLEERSETDLYEHLAALQKRLNDSRGYNRR